jgi:hypothetical protein
LKFCQDNHLLRYIIFEMRVLWGWVGGSGKWEMLKILTLPVRHFIDLKIIYVMNSSLTNDRRIHWKGISELSPATPLYSNLYMFHTEKKIQQ